MNRKLIKSLVSAVLISVFLINSSIPIFIDENQVDLEIMKVDTINTMSFIRYERELAAKAAAKAERIQTLKNLLDEARTQIYTEGKEETLKLPKEFAQTYQFAKAAVERWEKMPEGTERDQRYEDLDTALGTFVSDINKYIKKPEKLSDILEDLADRNTVFKESAPNP